MLVVGAGPTGLTTALLLSALGIRLTVVDRHHDVHPSPRAVHLDDEAVRILARAGVGEGFAAVSRPAAGLRLMDAGLRPFAVFRRDTTAGIHGHPEANLFDQPDLERLLRAEIARRPSVALRGGLEVTVVDQGRVELRDIATGAVEEVRADVVLGCDGAAAPSVMRSAPAGETCA